MTPDERIAQEVHTLRTEHELTQAQLGQLMRDRGWKWNQTTIWQTENNVRALRVAEAIDLAGILNVPLAELIGAADPNAEARRAGYLDGYKAGIAEAQMTLDDLPTKPLRLPY